MSVGGARTWVENRADRKGLGLSLLELWQYRELAVVLALRDLQVRYKQAVLGVAWAVIQPVVGMFVFTFVFHRLAKVGGGDEAPYQVVSLIGLLVWNFHSTAFNQASQSLVSNASLVTKVYFPRILAPLAAAFSPIVDMAITFVIVAVVMALYRVAPGVGVVTLPAAVLVLVAASFGMSLWFAALNVKYRDVRQVLGLLLQVWLFASPVAYPSSQLNRVPDWVRPLYYLNPMAGIIDWFRWALVDDPWPGWRLAYSLAVAAVLFAGGLVYFQRAERNFADVI